MSPGFGRIGDPPVPRSAPLQSFAATFLGFTVVGVAAPVVEDAVVVGGAVVGDAVVAAAPRLEPPVVGGVPAPEVGGLAAVGSVVDVLLPVVEVVRPVGDVVVVAPVVVVRGGRVPVVVV